MYICNFCGTELSLDNPTANYCDEICKDANLDFPIPLMQHLMHDNCCIPSRGWVITRGIPARDVDDAVYLHNLGIDIPMPQDYQAMNKRQLAEWRGEIRNALDQTSEVENATV